MTLPEAPTVEPHLDETLDRAWKVVVWNDPVNLIEYVIWVFRTVLGHDEQKATALTMKVHHEGRAIVADGPHEQAEIICFRLHRHGLWATIER